MVLFHRLPSVYCATMTAIDKFISVITDNFPDDSLTYQKGIPTFHPDNVSDAAKLISMASEHGQKLFITGFGNNIDPIGDDFTNLIVLRTDFLGQMIDVNESELSIVVGAGFPLREINAKIESAGLLLPIGELSYVGSVGGAISVGLGAYLNTTHWEPNAKLNINAKEKFEPQISIERYVLRLDVATPTGETKSFGVPSAKQLGGENFGHIFSSSWGLFGFIASVKLRVAPISAKGEYQDLRQREISHGKFLEITTGAENAKAQYFSQLRQKFDPQELFPIITN